MTHQSRQRIEDHRSVFFREHGELPPQIINGLGIAIIGALCVAHQLLKQGMGLQLAAQLYSRPFVPYIFGGLFEKQLVGSRHVPFEVILEQQILELLCCRSIRQRKVLRVVAPKELFGVLATFLDYSLAVKRLAEKVSSVLEHALGGTFPSHGRRGANAAQMAWLDE